MSTRAELKKSLERLIGDADEQTQLYESSTQRLYKTLGDVYLWWREARKYDGFLEDLYDKRNLVQRGQEEKFTRLVNEWSECIRQHSSSRTQQIRQT